MVRVFVVIALIVSFLISTFSFSFAYEKEIKSLSASMGENIAKTSKKRIAVVDFTDLQGNVTELGRFISEEISVDLTNTARGFEIIDRTHLKTILTEHKLSLSGIVDQNTVKKLGQIAGVDAIVTGSVTPLGDRVRVACKVIATDTARIISATKGDITKTKAVEELLSKGIETVSSFSPSTTVTAKAKQKVELKGLIFELQGCKMSGREIKCSFSIVNTYNKEKNIALHRSSYLYDDFGNQYYPSDGAIGGKRFHSFWGVPDDTRTSQLLSGTPENGFLIFEGVRQETKFITLGIEMSDGIKAVFRNIPLSR